MYTIEPLSYFSASTSLTSDHTLHILPHMRPLATCFCTYASFTPNIILITYPSHYFSIWETSTQLLVYHTYLYNNMYPVVIKFIIPT